MMIAPMMILLSKPYANITRKRWDPAEFADLPTNVQCDIVERACLIRAANDRLKAA
jgi:hypothetical protein